MFACFISLATTGKLCVTTCFYSCCTIFSTIGSFEVLAMNSKRSWNYWNIRWYDHRTRLACQMIERAEFFSVVSHSSATK